MEQFNLEKYLKNPARKVVTRDGRKVRILCTDFNNKTYPIVGEIQCMVTPEIFTEEGFVYKGISDMNDLFFAPEKHTGWVSIHRGSISGYCTDGIFDSEEKAKERAGAIAIVKVEWEE